MNMTKKTISVPRPWKFKETPCLNINHLIVLEYLVWQTYVYHKGNNMLLLDGTIYRKNNKIKYNKLKLWN
jgi:hypothetical protein